MFLVNLNTKYKKAQNSSGWAHRLLKHAKSNLASFAELRLSTNGPSHINAIDNALTRNNTIGMKGRNMRCSLNSSPSPPCKGSFLTVKALLHRSYPSVA